MQEGVFRNAEGFATNDTGDESAVIEAVETEIRIARRTCEIVNGSRACSKFLLGETNAGIYDIHVHTGADAVVMVGAVQRQIALVNAVKAPKSKLVRSNRLLYAGHYNLASFFDIFNSPVAAQRHGLRFGRFQCETLKRVLVNVLDLTSVSFRQFIGNRRQR